MLFRTRFPFPDVSFSIRIVIISTVFLRKEIGGLYDTQGPAFLTEPPNKLEFINSNGGKADCLARGNPSPSVEWVGQDNIRISSVPSIRHILSNGTIYFPPFDADAFRQDVHWTVYRCVVSNVVGTIFSRDVVVRAVVNQRYEPEVQSPGGFLNNNVLFRCSVPSFVKEHVSVTSWLQQPAFNIYPSIISDGKYHMLPTGELMIVNITRIDSQRTYRCRTHHRLTQEAAVSRNEGRIQLSDMRSSVPPILNKKLIVITAKAEDTIVTPCVAYANPRPEYKWFYKRNQQEIIIENQERFMVRDGTLVISNVKKSDSGVYYCRASNKEGSETLEMQLSVTAPLSVHIHPTSQTSHLGKSAEFECTIHGFPHSTIYWLKDGQPIRFGARIRQITETRLQIVSVSKDDRGMYQCVVRNDLEMSLGSAELRLGEVYPHLAYKFIEQTMQPGPSVSLKCSASGNPTPQITWLLDGFPLQDTERLLKGQYVTIYGDVVSHVNISSVKPEDGGEYECIAENRAGRTSHSARLNIYGLPYVRPMSPISAVAGKDLIVKCPVAGYPIDTVIWEKEGVRLPTTLRQRVSNNSLVIENVQRDSDQGSYTCIARNKQGHSSQRTVQIRVIVPPKITPFTFARDLKLGDRISVQCVVVSGDLPITFVWLKDGEPPPEGETITRSNPFTSDLSIESIQAAHSGNYTCRASNLAATVSHTAPLSVNVPPKWVVEPQREQNVILGNAISLHCQADGFPKPTVTWKQAMGTQIKSNNVQPGPDEYREINYNTPNTIRLENGTLAILRASEEHEGYYMCEAHNGVGAGISKFIHLVVHAGPRFQLRSRQETARKGEPVHLRCEAEGDQPMDIVWKLRGSQIDGAYDQRYLLKNTSISSGFISELTILDVAHRDRGEYMCVASNAYGQDHSNILLLVQEPPSFPRNLHVAGQTSRSMTLSWSPPTTPSDAKVSNYILQYKEARDVWHEHNPQKTFPGNKTIALISGLKPATMYHFRLYAENELGTSASSDVLHGVTEGEAPAGPPLQVKAEPMSPTQVRLTWQPPDRNLWNGDLLGYNIGFKKLKNENQDYNWTHFRESTGLPGDFRLINLSKFMKYSIVLTAVNAKGDGPPSDPIIVETLEDAPSASPQDVQCTSLTAQSLQISWRPPPSSKIHGLIQGYKVLYEPADEWFETSKRETKMTSSMSTVLHGLQPYTNYSLQLLAYTRAGDGVKSPILFCMTDESMPEAPAAIKAVVSSDDTVIVSWLPPRRLNGILTKYTVFIRVLDKGSEVKIIKGTLPAQHLYYEASGLSRRETYEAWVTASTKVGQGQSTAVVQLVPSQTVPAAIISFGRLVVVPWKTEVNLPCLHVGQPRPTVEWRLGDVKISKHSKVVDIEDKELRIENVMRIHEGNYSCHVKNNLGSDHIIFALVVQVPPTPPILLTTAVTTDSVQLQWKQGDSGGAAVRGFILSFRKEASEWEELLLEPRTTTYLMEGLDCGSSYQFRLTAYNKIGSGVASKLISIVTKGSRPIPPSKAHFLSINSSATILHFRTWGDGGCPLTHFSLSYRRPSGSWIQIPGSFEPSQDFILNELLPGTEYVVKVNGHNTAGVTSQEYSFSTLFPHGGPSAPNSATAEDEHNYSSFYVDTQIIALGAVSILSLLLAVTGICFCLHKRPEREDICLRESQSTAALDNKRNMEQREQYYTTVRKPSQSPCRDISALERIPEYSEDIYPYATFHLPEQESMSGNPQRQSYLYESQLKQPEATDHYGKSRSGRVRRKSKSLKSESEEYDSLGSDTDTEHGTSSRTESSNHLCDNNSSIRYPPNQSTINRHRKKEVDDHNARYVARLAVQARPPHHNIHQHHPHLQRAGSGTSTEPSPIFEKRDRAKMNRRRYGYEDGKQNGMEILLLSSIN